MNREREGDEWVIIEGKFKKEGEECCGEFLNEHSTDLVSPLLEFIKIYRFLNEHSTNLGQTYSCFLVHIAHLPARERKREGEGERESVRERQREDS